MGYKQKKALAVGKCFRYIVDMQLSLQRCSDQNLL